MIEQKASEIEQRLEKYEENHGDTTSYEKKTLEEEKELPANKLNQIVPFIQNMDNNGALQTIRKDSNQIETLSDVDDAEINQLILSEDEKRLKTIIWNSLNKEWIQEQKQKKRDKKAKSKKLGKNKKSLRVKSNILNFIKIDYRIRSDESGDYAY